MQQPPGSESRGPPRTLKGSCHRLRPNTDQQLADSHDAAGLGRSASPGAGPICECEHCSLTSATWNPRRSGQRVLAGHSGVAVLVMNLRTTSTLSCDIAYAVSREGS